MPSTPRLLIDVPGGEEEAGFYTVIDPAQWVEWKENAVDEFREWLSRVCPGCTGHLTVYNVQGRIYGDRGEFVIKIEGYGIYNNTTWVIFKNCDDAFDAAYNKVYEQLEKEPDRFEDDFIIRHIRDRSWEEYVDRSASASAGDISVGDMLDIGLIDQEEWDSAEEEGDVRKQEQLEEHGREQEYRNEVEVISEEGLMHHFKAWAGDKWAKEALAQLDFDYDAATDEYTRHKELDEILSPEYNDEIEIGDDALAYRVE